VSAHLIDLFVPLAMFKPFVISSEGFCVEKFAILFLSFFNYVFLTHRHGASLGKYVCKIKVVSADGSKLSLGQVLIKYSYIFIFDVARAFFQVLEHTKFLPESDSEFFLKGVYYARLIVVTIIFFHILETQKKMKSITDLIANTRVVES
jgi:uncharacterized RDD family membrane protein YckC